MQNLRVAFFSRGRGHGHAIPDLAIASGLVKRRPEIDVTFVSYATGAETLRRSQFPVVDLGLPEENPYLPTLFRALDVLHKLKPDLIFAHEEFAALPAARIAKLKSIFISSWLPADGKISAESLPYASSIIVTGEAGIFPLPAGVTVTPIYVGPIYRAMKFSLSDRASVRAEMGIAKEALLITVVPGGSNSEEQSPIADTVISAFFNLQCESKHLFWVSTKDHESLTRRTEGFANITLTKFVDPIERLLVASDVVITKGTHGITLDCCSLGVPSISLSPRNNPIDDILVPTITSNLCLDARAIDANILSQYISDIARARGSSPSPDLNAVQTVGADRAVAAIDAEIHRLLA